MAKSTYSKPNNIKINWPKGTPIPTVGAQPAAAVAPTPMPQPFDPNQELLKLQSGMNISLADSEGTYQQGRPGYLTGYNASGARDFSNPYSQAQLLEDEYKRSLTGTGNSYAAQGQLYSGARTRALARDDRLYAQSSAGLRDQAADTYHSISANRLGTYAANATGTNQGAFNSLLKSVYGGS